MTRAAEPRWLSQADKLGRWFENLLLSTLLAGLTLLAGAQILLRDAFSIGVSWADGAIRLAVLWLAVLGAVAAARDDKHIAIKLLAAMLPARLQRPARVLVDAFAAAVAGLLAWYSWVFVHDSARYGDVLLNNWPAWIFQAILPVAFALIAYRYALNCLRGALGGS